MRLPVTVLVLRGVAVLPLLLAIGCKGEKGDGGAAGAQGSAGPAGDAGSVGPAGPSGDAGTTGSPGPGGDAGAQGSAGLSGDAGATGPTGPAGPSGDAGTTAAVDYSTTNLVSLHDSTSPSYNGDCVSCHSAQLSGWPLDGGVFDGGVVGVVDGGVRPLYHPRHIALVGTYLSLTGNAACTYCHSTVVYGQMGVVVANAVVGDGGVIVDGGAATVLRRRNNPVSLCKPCHAPGFRSLYQP